MDEEVEVGSAPLLHITFISNHLAPLGFSATALFTPFESAWIWETSYIEITRSVIICLQPQIMTFRWHCISQPVLRLAEKMTKKIGKNVCRDLETCTSSSRSTLTKPKFTAIGMVEVVTVYCTFSTFDRPFRISMVISPFYNNLWNILSDSICSTEHGSKVF